LYQFPIIKDAEYIIYSHKESAYPIRDSEFKGLVSSLENSKNWEIIYRSEDLTILKKKAPRHA
jgi:hypothetical protein